MSRKILLILLSMILVAVQAGCGLTPKYPARNSTAPDFYLIKMKDGTRYKVKGSDIFRRNDDIVIPTQGGTFESKYPINEVAELKAVGPKKGSRVLTGLGIGAATGLGIGLAAGLLSGGSCATAEEQDDCEGMRNLGAIIGGAGGTVVGGLIGLGVGAAIPKRPKVMITPTFLRDETQTQAGIGFSTSF